MANRDCPHCGCNDTEVIKQPEPGRARWWGSGTARCNHCAFVFSFRPPIDGTPDGNPPAKIIPKLTCDGCGGAMRVSQTLKGHRWYKCVDCGLTKKAGRKDARD